MGKSTEYYCVMVRRNYEDIWRVIGKWAAREEAQAFLDEKLSYEGVFNYKNAELRIVSRSEAKLEFGKRWEYVPIGTPKPVPKVRVTTKGRSVH